MYFMSGLSNKLNRHLCPYFANEETEVQLDQVTIPKSNRGLVVGLKAKACAPSDMSQKRIHMAFNRQHSHSQLGLFIIMKSNFFSLHTSLYSQSPEHLSGHRRDSINGYG